MFGKKSQESVNVPNGGGDFHSRNTEDDIFGSPSFCPRDPTAQRQVVTPTGFDTTPSKPVESFRKDGVHAKQATEESNVVKKLEAVKLWSLNTIKCTKQVIGEKLGTAVPTCDEQLDLRIQTLRQMQRQYRFLLESIRQLSTSLVKTIHCQRELAGQLATLGQQQLELSETFAHNAETQKSLAVNGEKLICALETICSGLSTLTHQTFDDTMLTIRHMNMARIEFDANRKEADAARAATTNANDLAQSRRVEQALTRFRASEENFLRLKAAVDAKLRLLHENRIRVMQHNLLLLHNATTAYSTGNIAMLDQTLKQFNIKLASPMKSATLNRKSSERTDRNKRSSFRKSTNGTS